MDPQVSVIVPCFNARATIGRCIESVISSSSDIAVEMVLVDDGSSDDTASVVRDYVQEGRVKIALFSTKHSGANAARNLGLLNAKGRYVQFLDADDCVRRSKFTKSIKLFESSDDIKVVYSNGVVRNLSNECGDFAASHENISAIVERRFYKFLFSMNTVMPLWRKDFLLDNELLWDENQPCWQESEFYFRVLLKLRRMEEVRHIDEPLFERYVSAGSIGSANTKCWYLEGKARAVNSIKSVCVREGCWNSCLEKQRIDVLWSILRVSVVHNVPVVWPGIVQDILGAAPPFSKYQALRVGYPLVKLLYDCFWRK